MPDLINYSEFATLTQCERKFVYAYHFKLEEQGERKGLHLGTLCHQWFASWLAGNGAVLSQEWDDDIEPGGKPGAAQHYLLSDFDEELVERAKWLASRYVECYGPQPPSSWTIIGAERWMTRQFDDFTLVGRCDGLVIIDGQLWLIELKTYAGKPGPLAYAQVSPQLGCYSLLVEEDQGQRPFGVLYQGIYTYQWKRAKPVRLPEESFDRIEVVLGDDHLRTAEAYLGSAVARRNDLLGGTHPLPNVGTGCGWCGFKARCWNDLGGVEEQELIVEDSEEPV
jgi:hypothetical protein